MEQFFNSSVGRVIVHTQEDTRSSPTRRSVFVVENFSPSLGRYFDAYNANIANWIIQNSCWKLEQFSDMYWKSFPMSLRLVIFQGYLSLHFRTCLIMYQNNYREICPFESQRY